MISISIHEAAAQKVIADEFTFLSSRFAEIAENIRNGKIADALSDLPKETLEATVGNLEILAKRFP